MKLKVSHDDLEIVSSEILSDSLLFSEILKIWNESINELSNNWQGEDASLFYENVNSYLEHMKKVPEFYDIIANFIKNSNVKYMEADLESRNEFSNRLMEEDRDV